MIANGDVDDAAPSGARSPALPRDVPHATSERSVVVDNARAIGIVLVVVGHAPALPGWLRDAIFTFHMPLFFFLSGLVVAPQRIGHSLARRAGELARSLLRPYLFFFAVAWIYWLLVKRHGTRAAEFEALSWWDPLGGLLSGTGDALYVDPALWFFPCLFLTALGYQALRKALSPSLALGVCACAALCLVVARPAGRVLPWSAECAVVALAFYAAGPLLRDFVLRPPHGAAQRIPRAVTALLAGAVCLAAPRLAGPADLSLLRFGGLPALYLPVAACGTLGALSLAALLPPSRIGRWLSINTIVVFPLHMLFFSGVTGVATIVFGRPAFRDDAPWVAVPYVVVALSASWVASAVLQRVAPWLFGARAARASSPVGAPSPPTSRGGPASAR